MFDFMSPFDTSAGGAASAPSVKKTPVPALPQDERSGPEDT
jgi:hypothetical protein